MKKVISLLILICIIITAFAGVGALAAEPQIVEFIANGSFEELDTDGKPSRWNLSSVTIFGEHAEISDKAKDGENSIYMNGTTGKTSGKTISQLITGLTPGQTYTFSVDVRVDAVATTGANCGTIDVYFRDANGKEVATVGGSNVERKPLLTADKKWHTEEMEVVIPANAVGAQICLRLYDGAEGYFDNVSFTGEMAQQICDILDPLPGAENMLKNSDLEIIGTDGIPENWTIRATDKVTVVQDKDRGIVLRFEDKGASHPWASQRVDGFEVGDVYQVSAWIKTEYMPSLKRNQAPSFKVEMYNANNSTISEAMATDFQVTNGQWQKVAVQFVIPEGVTYAIIYPRLYGTGIIYYDDIQLHKVAEEVLFEMDSASVNYEEWKRGEVELFFNYDIPAGATYNIVIKDGDTVLLEDTVPVEEYVNWEYSLDLLKEKAKEYTLEVTYVDENGNKGLMLTNDLFKFHRPARITEDGQFLDGNGEIFYPVLGYHNELERLGEIKEFGVNVLRSGDNIDKTIRAGSNPAWREGTKLWLDTAWYEHGQQTMLCLYGGSTFGTETYFENMESFVKDLGDHPGLLGYLIQDEPHNDWNTERVEAQLKETYIRIKAADPDAIVAFVANRPQHWENDTDWSDLIICDRYPTLTIFRNLQYNFIKHARIASDYKKPVWTLNAISKGNTSYPLEGTMERNMVYQGLFAGTYSNGYIGFYTNNSGFWDNPDLQAAVKALADGEHDDAVKAFITGEYPTFCEYSYGDDLAHSGLYLGAKVPDKYWYKAYVKDGQLYLLVLNHEEKEATPVSIPLTSYDGSVTIGDFTATVVDSDSTSQTVTGSGVFEATIDPNAATLFKINTNADFSSLKGTKYDDLQNFGWAKNAIATIEEMGIGNDTGLHKYSPEKNITRADFAGYLIRTLGLTADATDTFADVDNSYIYAKEIAIGKALGILNGVGDNKYNPDAPISRQDLMIICTRGMKLVKEMNLDTSKLDAFSDAGLIADYAREGITGMVTEGIVKGNADGTINPLGNTTRAEAAVIMDRILNWK